MDWQLQQAKNRFSEIVRRAQTEDAQIITVRGKQAAVVLSVERYEELLGQSDSLAEFMQRSPWAETALAIERADEPGRDVRL